jgi:hypothetical protein
MPRYTVLAVFTAATHEDVEAATPEAAIDAAEAYASLCHQCGSALDLDDAGCPYFYIVLDEEGEEVYRDDPLDEARAERDDLRARLVQALAALDADPQSEEDDRDE